MFNGNIINRVISAPKRKRKVRGDAKNTMAFNSASREKDNTFDNFFCVIFFLSKMQMINILFILYGHHQYPWNNVNAIICPEYSDDVYCIEFVAYANFFHFILENFIFFPQLECEIVKCNHIFCWNTVYIFGLTMPAIGAATATASSADCGSIFFLDGLDRKLCTQTEENSFHCFPTNTVSAH